MGDTIAAIATPAQKSAIGIIRISGDDAFSVAGKVFFPKNGKPLSKQYARRIIYGELRSVTGDVLDHCLAVLCKEPKSYTGENTVELQCHGSPAVLSSALRALFASGARQAGAGEFTKRAFLNGKLDLIQAEAVMDLIDAETEPAMRNAASQLGGAVSIGLDKIYSSYLDILAHFHAIIDYPDEDLEPFEAARILDALENAASALSKLSESFDRGRIIKEGVKCAIVGKPNAGKSSLLNALLGYERAIVTPVAGTTRDTIEEKAVLGGILLRLTDTAGMRETDDAIEKIGVARSLDAASQAELVLAVFDGSQPLTAEDLQAIEAAADASRSIAVINKADLEQVIDMAPIEKSFKLVCRVSALDRTGLDILDSIVKEMFEDEAAPPAGEILTNLRQAEAVSRALKSTRLAYESLSSGFTPDAVLTDVEAALSAIGDLTGKSVREDITARIFERFCVGK